MTLKKDSPESKKLSKNMLVDLRNRLQRRLFGLPIAALIPLQFFCSIPLQLYVANAAELNAPLSAVLLYCIGFLLLSLLALGLIGLAIPDKWFPCWCAVLFFGGVLMYLQSNFLFIDVGILNGQEIDLSPYKSKMIVNSLLWAVVIGVSALLAIRYSKLMMTMTKYGATALCAMQILIIVLLFLTPGNSQTMDDVTPVVTNEGLDELSSEENVVVFIMDMFDDSYMTEILEKNPDISQSLDGFVRYTNATGRYSTTAYGAPFVITQQPLLNQGGDYAGMLDLAYSNSELLNRLLKKGYRIQLFTDLSLIARNFYENCANLIPGARYYVSDRIQFCKLMTKLSLLRGAPDYFKTKIRISTSQFENIITPNQENFYSISGTKTLQFMKNNAIQTVKEPIYSLIHIKGAHYPYTIDENGQEVEDGSITYYEQALGAVRAVLAYLEHMKESGVYDNSTIILTADHGYYHTGVVASPVLMSKSKGSRGELTYDGSPVSQDIIQDIILSDVEKDYVPRVKTGPRTFYSYNLNHGERAPMYVLTEWNISDASNKFESFSNSGYQIDFNGNRIPLSKFNKYQFGKVLSLGVEEIVESYFDYGTGRVNGTKTDLIGNESKITFSHEPVKKDMLLTIEYQNYQDNDIIITAYCNGNACGQAVLGVGQSLARWTLPETSLDGDKTEIILRYEGVQQDFVGLASKVAYVRMKIDEYKDEDLSIERQTLVTPLTDLRAHILSYEFSGDHLFVRVKNTSSEEWLYENQVRCYIRRDSEDSGIRANLTPGKPVAPGEEVVFRFAEDAEELKRDYADHLVEVQMLQEGYSYFGDIIKIEFE